MRAQTKWVVLQLAAAEATPRDGALKDLDASEAT